jgi:hypothetical protein
MAPVSIIGENKKRLQKFLERSMIELSVNSQMKIELRENPNLLYLRIAMFREVRYSSTCLDNLVSLK